MLRVRLTDTSAASTLCCIQHITMPATARLSCAVMEQPNRGFPAKAHAQCWALQQRCRLMIEGLQQAHPPWLEAPCPFHLHCIARCGLLFVLKAIHIMQPAKQNVSASPAESAISALFCTGMHGPSMLQDGAGSTTCRVGTARPCCTASPLGNLCLQMSVHHCVTDPAPARAES